MQIKKTLLEIGNSVAVIIPNEICQQMKLKPGDVVLFDINHNGITLSKELK